MTNLTIRGNDSNKIAKIKCIYDSSMQDEARGFGFLWFRDFSIENMIFESCGGVIPSVALNGANDTSSVFYLRSTDKAVLLMNSCFTCQIRNVTITKHYGYGIVAVNNALTIVLDRLIVENNFVYNCYNNINSTACDDLYARDHSEGGGVLFLIKATSASELNITDSQFLHNRAILTSDIVCVGLYNELSKEDAITQTALPSGGALTLIFERSEDDGIFHVHISNTTFHLNVGICFGAVLIVYQDDPMHGSVNIDNSTFQDNIPLIEVSSLYDDFFGAAVTAYIRHQDSSETSTVLSITDSNFYTNPYKFFSIANPFISVVQFSAATVESMIYFNSLFSNISQGFLYATALGTVNIDIYMQDIIIKNGLSLRQLQLLIQGSGIFTFTNVANVVLNGSHHEKCVFNGNVGSVFLGSSTELHLTGNITFIQNSASQGSNGAAISLRSYSHLWLKEPLNVIFQNNSAVYGGAIYSLVQDKEGQSCLFQYETQQRYSLENISNININLSFIHNTASLGGNSIYADYLYNCAILNTPFTITTEQIPQIYDTIFHYTSPVLNGNQQISSTPKGLCICTSDEQNSSSTIEVCGSQGINTVWNITTHPGESFTLSLVAVDDIQNPVYSPVVSSLVSSPDLELLQEHTIEQTGPYCTDVLYSIYVYSMFDNSSNFTEGMLVLNPLSTSQGSLRISIQIYECPPTFQLFDNGVCDCIDLLLEKGLLCDIDSGIIFSQNDLDIWIGVVDNEDTEYTVGVANHCTTRYCKQSPVYIYNISNPAALCQGNREGVLCGKCMEGYSVVAGDPDCRVCDNISLLTLLFYAVVGVLWVVVLFILRITVTSGTIHGLIFYANLFQINTYYFLEANNSYMKFLIIFMSFLNLNLGFPLCLYDGMTTLVKQYLEYVFVIYLWTLAIILIVCSKYSSKLSKLISHSAVPVLATIFQLSYSKLLYVVVSVLAFSSLSLEDRDGLRYSKTVWYYDGEVSYFKGGHAFMCVLVLLMLLIFLVPYTVILTGVKVFARYRFINRFLPLIDAFTSPYKDKYRFWYGLRLWVLIIVYISFTILREYPRAVILIQALLLVLLLCAQSSIMPFKNHFLNVLDLFFVVNAAFLSAWGLYFTTSDTARLSIASGIFMTLVFVVFCGIVVYHAWQVFGCQCKLLERLLKRPSSKGYELQVVEKENQQWTDNSYDSSRLRASYIEDYAEVVTD